MNSKAVMTECVIILSVYKSVSYLLVCTAVVDHDVCTDLDVLGVECLDALPQLCF